MSKEDMGSALGLLTVVGTVVMALLLFIALVVLKGYARASMFFIELIVACLQVYVYYYRYYVLEQESALTYFLIWGWTGLALIWLLLGVYLLLYPHNQTDEKAG